MKIIARIQSDFPTKFGIPRQSGLADTEAIIVFEPEFRQEEALRGIEQYSHLWLIWKFSEVSADSWSPTVRPPRLGGNKRMGVFATRSPFRPNPIGLSSVKLCGIEKTDQGLVLKVCGADLMDGTPIYDIKPYIPYSDCHPEANGGFAHEKLRYHLEVNCPSELLSVLPQKKREPLIQILSQDPRPQYIDDPSRIFGFPYAGFEVRFTVNENILTVISIDKSD
ncbi:MAG: tRNA (N6-threonylcarbamoyladenosine(37)-N6)-methyltransferase TrmO [Ruminococcus sp.]|nr:tRNA (N6-threonylcarbamoyladenosine(37)-N6)-methyltransferase TrmO [Ruminococcus sp.]